MLSEKEKEHDCLCYVHIFEDIEAAILSGRMAPGQRLPAIRQMAVQFGTNPNTVQRAVTALKRNGLLTGGRGAGLFVTTDAECIRRRKETHTQQLVEELRMQLQAMGYSISEIKKMF